MKVIAKATIRRVEDGRTVVHENDWTPTHERWVRGELSSPGHDLDGTIRAIHFWWEGGNGSCDCNKSLFFYELIGEEDPDYGGPPNTCIGEGRFELVDLDIAVTE